jgi:membrane protease YdiL (CAAX protease family)
MRSLTWRDAVIAWTIAWVGGVLIALGARSFARGTAFPALPTYAAHAWLLAVPLFWLFVLRRSFRVGSFSRRELRPWAWSWLVAAVLILAAGPFIHGGVRQSWPVMAQWLVMATVFVGPAEEFLSRGLVQTGLNNSVRWSLQVRSRRVKGGTLLASVMFGLAHLSNLLSSPLSDVLPQVAGATLIGLAIGLMYDRFPNLWGASILHNVIDGLQAILSYL